MARSLFVFVIAVAFLALVSAQVVSVPLRVDVARVGGEIAKEVGSFNFDWWPNNSTQEGWQNAGLFNINLNSQRLRVLAKALAPAHLRIGGTLGDTIVYEIPGKPHLPCVQGQSCLNMTRWEEVVDFARHAGITIVFGLNERYGPGTPGTWNSSNTRDFLEYIKAHRQEDVIYGFELGNELDLARYPGSACAKDFVTLHNILVELWPDANRRPKLVGPDATPNDKFIQDFLQGAGHVVDVLTWHLYIGYGLNPDLPTQLLDPKFLNRSRTFAAPIQALRDTLAPRAQLWVGETAAAYHSGRNGTTNCFEDGFWYLNQLGALALMQHSVQCRQTLVGGNYGLIAKESFKPNPDYWTLLLLKRLIGTRVFSVSVKDTDHLLTYAYCSKQHSGGLVLTLANLATEHTYTLDLANSGIAHATPREEYHLSSTSLDSRDIYLNGKVLTLTTRDQIPHLEGEKVTNSGALVTLKPLTYTLIEFSNAQVAHCR